MRTRRSSLSQRRKAQGFTQEALAERLEIDPKTIRRWERGETEPVPWMRRKLAAQLQVSLEKLETLLQTGGEDRSSGSNTAAEATARQGGGDSTNRRNALQALSIGLTTGSDFRNLVLDAARESSKLSSTLNKPPISDLTIGDIADKLRRIATEYVLAPDLDMILIELVSLRDGLARLIEFAVRPNNIRDLYALMAATCSLLGSVSHDLAEPHAALSQARSAIEFAELAGHRSLASWAQCTSAMIKSWWSTPESVLDQVNESDSYGISGLRLRGLAARAHAQLGDRVSTQDAITQAQRAREQLPGNEDLSDFGAVFSFSSARQHYYNAMAYVEIHDWSAAISEATSTIALYQPTTDHPWPTTRTLTQINCARAFLHTEGPGAALDNLQPVLEIPRQEVIPQVIAGVRRLKTDLHSTWTNSPTCRELDETIRTFEQTRSGGNR